MPRGVNDQFLKILHNERKTGLRRTLIALALLPLAYVVAELTDEPPFGIVVLIVFAAFVGGIVAGALVAAFRTRRYNTSLLDHWNQWQRMSLSCTRVGEVSRHVEGKGPAPQLTGTFVGLLVFANLILLTALWFELGWGYLLGLALTVLNGAVLGASIGHALWTVGWTRRFRKALDDLLQEGQIGLWGEV